MKNVAIAGLLSALSLASVHTAFAAEDSRYPGYNNEPKVLYQDWALIKSYGSEKSAAHVEKPAAHDAKYPGAYFDPYVIYRSPDFESVGSKHR